jgi:phage FluMu protein Com
MELINMQKPVPKNVAQEMVHEAPDMSYEKYPYGLKIHLSTDELEKLDIKVENCKVGNEVVIKAIAEITDVRQSERMNRRGKTEEQNDIDIQITDMNFVKVGSKDVSAKTLGSLKGKSNSREEY